MTAAAQRLKAARSIYLQREGAPTAGDRWFSLYLIAFFAGWYVLPVAYLAGNYLEQDLAARLTAAGSAHWLAAALVGLGVVVMWVGRVQGPVYLSPFMAHTLLATDLQRRRVLLPPTLARLVGIALVVCVPAAFGIFTMTQAGVWDWERFPVLLGAVFFGGLLLGVLAGLGQRLGIRWLILLSILGAVTGIIHALVPDVLWASPAGWFAAIWSGEGLGSSAVWPVALLAAAACLAIASMALIPTFLNGLSAQRVLIQARRLSEARLFTSTGSINDAVELFRAKPTPRFSGATVSSAAGPFGVLFSGLRRDFFTSLRAPLALTSAAVLVPAGAALLASSTQFAGAAFGDSQLLITVPLGVLGGVLLFLGTGSLTEGWRQLKNEFDAAALYGWSASSSLMRRLLWPVLTTALLTSIGTVAAVLMLGLHWAAAGWAYGLALLALSARFFQSMRNRDIPVEFLAPTVIPGGMDMSAVKILIWLGDGILITATGVLAVVVIPWEPGVLAAVLSGMIVITMVWGWVRTGQQFLVQAPSAATPV